MVFDIDKETNKVEEMVLEMVKKLYPESKMVCLVNKGIELNDDTLSWIQDKGIGKIKL